MDLLTPLRELSSITIIGGKYQGSNFIDIFNNDFAYCQLILDNAVDGWMLDFKNNILKMLYLNYEYFKSTTKITLKENFIIPFGQYNGCLLSYVYRIDPGY